MREEQRRLVLAVIATLVALAASEAGLQLVYRLHRRVVGETRRES